MESKTRGQSLVEFALILPFLLMLLLGIVEGARLAWAYITVQEAAREAARYAVSGKPFNDTDDPWTFGADISDGYGGLCLQGVDDFGTCDTSDPSASDAIDRVEAISNMALVRTEGLPVDQYALTSAVYTATGYYDRPSTMGVLVMGFTDAYSGTATVDNAGKEGLNVFVQVYYNVEMLDPIYTGIVRAVTGDTYIRVQGAAQMQNEGVDTALGSIPPAGIATPVPPTGGGGGGDPGLQPIILSPDGSSFEVGTAIRVRLEQHTAGNHYDIYLGNETICDNVEANNFGIWEGYCNIRPDYPPGDGYPMYSTVHGGTESVVTPVYIDITRINDPTLLVEDSYLWPAGSQVTLQVRSHLPNTEYDLAFNGSNIGTVLTDAFGDADFDWIIPSGTPTRLQPDPPYDLESLEHGSGVLIASSGIYITVPQIVVQGGTDWPAGSTLIANLRRHAPYRTYEVRCNGTSIGSFETDGEGRSVASIFCTVPVGFADSPPPYTITSYDNGILIGQVDVTISTPPTPYLVVIGGYDWPAGSPIEIQMFDHEPNWDYRLYFEDWNVINPSISTDLGGFAQTAYIIPLTATQATSYTLRSYDIANTTTVATRTVTVRATPAISVTEGSVVQPGTFIHVNLTRHARDTVYNVFLDNVAIGSIQTDSTGHASLGYDLDDFGLTGGPFVIESRLSGVVAAQTDLTIVSADLAVVNIELPDPVPYNQTIPITVTIRNSSTVALAGTWFDTDIYIDPEHVPDVLYPYPPGEHKLWLDSLNPGQEFSFSQDVILYGADDHTIYARTNTSQYITEQDAASPDNNMMSVLAVAESCGARLKEAITTNTALDSAFGAGWAGVAYGNASSPTPSATIADDVISLNSAGSSTVQSNDDNGGYYYYYHEVSGDFDAHVRLTSQSTFSGISTYAKFGLEVRESTASTARKVYQFQTNSSNIQSGRRTSTGGSVSVDYAGGSGNNLPVWARITRTGNQFALYYAYTTNVPPEEGDWVGWASYDITMSDPVLVGLANASYSSSTANTVTFDNFDVCIDPSNANGCGTVREEAGLVVIDSNNYVQNIARNGKDWREQIEGGRQVMKAQPNTGTNNNTGYTTASPELQYDVEFETAGDYYVWVYGAGASGSDDSLHVGINGAANDQSDRMYLNNADTLQWRNDTMDGVRSTISGIGAGINTINVWMREDGAYFSKILLTTNPDYTPSGDIDQSPCLATITEEPYPPGLTVCTSPSSPLLSNADFEENPGYQTAWMVPSTAGTNISSANPHDSNLSLRMITYQSGSGFKEPYAWQNFIMSDWITDTTTINLSLWKSTDQHGTAQVTDTLKMVLRTTGMTATQVTTPTVIARGNEGFGFPDNYIQLGPIDLVPAMAAVGQNPADYAGQDMQLYLYDDSNDPNCLAFGPSCFWTDFYLDDFYLEICTSQPLPEPDPSKAIVRGDLRVWISGIPTQKAGVRVWAYQQNGAMLATYSIHDSTYGFYELDPGEYVIYSEYWEGPDLYNALTTINVSSGVTYNRSLDLY